ncbi:MAG: hypothetical protein BWX79_01988 [Alphaproteobacteria bacterium ADurb.Bin100]|nr:MAG: hypothetical protein BWX79_01988 [Alphaproteobacteria bacterium ADurb.Bin100]
MSATFIQPLPVAPLRYMAPLFSVFSVTGVALKVAPLVWLFSTSVPPASTPLFDALPALRSWSSDHQ